MPDRNGNLDTLDCALIIAKKTDRIKELEQQLDDWKDKAMSERHDLNMCEQKVERLREALEKIKSLVGEACPLLSPCNTRPKEPNCFTCNLYEIAEQALESIP